MGVGQQAFGGYTHTKTAFFLSKNAFAGCDTETALEKLQHDKARGVGGEIVLLLLPGKAVYNS